MDVTKGVEITLKEKRGVRSGPGWNRANKNGKREGRYEKGLWSRTDT